MRQGVCTKSPDGVVATSGRELRFIESGGFSTVQMNAFRSDGKRRHRANGCQNGNRQHGFHNETSPAISHIGNQADEKVRLSPDQGDNSSFFFASLRSSGQERSIFY